MIGRLAAVLPAVALAVTASTATGEPLPPNELGRVMILEYHKIDYPEERWTRTPENFRRDLQTLYQRGYRLINLGDLIAGRINVPAGTTPVVLTFDDSSPGQFRYLSSNGSVEIDPKSGIGVLEAFVKERPDFGRAGTFFVLPGASRPNKLFNQDEHATRKLRFLVSSGYEIGNHTLWHANLGKYDEKVVRKQLAEAQEWVQRHVPDYKLRTLALPHGVYPRDVSWALHGTVNGQAYRHDGIMMVAGGAAPSPFAKRWDPVRLPRIQAIDSDLGHWLAFFEKNPHERFVSDGNPATVTIPAAQRDRLRSTLPGTLAIVER